MNWQQFLFSFRGRVSRQRYWLMAAISIPFVVAASFINGSFEHFADWPGGLLILLILWHGLAVSVKRWHDRDKSGWWVLISLIPIIGDLWVLVECGFLRGTPGENEYGPDPLEQKT